MAFQDVQNFDADERVQGRLPTEAHHISHEDHLEISIRSHAADLNRTNANLVEEQVEVPAIQSTAVDSTILITNAEQMSIVIYFNGKELIPHPEQLHRSDADSTVRVFWM